MARPQVEDGYTPIANELAEALARINLTAHESRILWCIFRHTYGWKKRSDRISYTQFQSDTGIDRRHVGRSLVSLKNRKIIICEAEGYSMVYSIQKNYELWQEFATIQGNSIATVSGNSIATIQGNDLPPSEATDSNINLPPSGDILPPFQDKLPPTHVSNLPPSGAPTKERKKIQKKLQKKEYARAREEITDKKKYGEFENVFLKDEEYEKLKQKLGPPHADDLIEQLSAYMKQSPANARKYIDHYATILNWSRRDGRTDGKHQANPVRAGIKYTAPPNYDD